MNTHKNAIEKIRTLAKKVAEIAALDRQEETRRLWKKLNALEPERPMVMIDQVPWHEMELDGELTPVAEDPIVRRAEISLRRTLYQWNHMPADMVVEPVITVPRAFTPWNFGFAINEHTASVDSANEVKSHAYKDQISTEEDLEKISCPEIVEDTKETERRISLVREAVGDALQVIPEDPVPMFRGVEPILLDLAMRPDFIHRTMEKFTNAYLALLDQLEAKGFLPESQALIHCTGAWSDELENKKHSPPVTGQLWTAGMAQLFSSVSPEMHKEFDIDYAVKWYRRFGLGYYGCCEPLDGKMHYVREIPHLRKVSMSPWVNEERAAESIQGDFVCSRKPNPAVLTKTAWDPDEVRAITEATIATCRRHKTPLEIILKDISTVGYSPQHLWEWESIVMETVKR